MSKDWSGNKKSTYVTLGASNHSKSERHPEEYYATHPSTIKPLFEREEFAQEILECSCGEGHLSKAMEELGKVVTSTDLIDRGYGRGDADFLKEALDWDGDIITNPPYKFAQEFVEKAMDIIKDGNKVAMFLKLQFLEGQKRAELFKKYPPKTIYVFSKRQICAMNGEFDKFKSSAVAYAWYVWEKGIYSDPIIKWIN